MNSCDPVSPSSCMINSDLDLSHQQRGGGLLCPAEAEEGEGMGEQGGAEGAGREGKEEARELRAPPYQ